MAPELVAAVLRKAVDAENLRESPASAMEHRDEARALAVPEQPEHKKARESYLGPMAGQPGDQAVPTTDRGTAAADVQLKDPDRRRWATIFRHHQAEGRPDVAIRIAGLVSHPAPERRAARRQAQPRTAASRKVSRTLATEIPIPPSAVRVGPARLPLPLPEPPSVVAEQAAACPS